MAVPFTPTFGRVPHTSKPSAPCVILVVFPFQFIRILKVQFLKDMLEYSS
jgi:hypothetical protein